MFSFMLFTLVLPNQAGGNIELESVEELVCGLTSYNPRAVTYMRGSFTNTFKVFHRQNYKVCVHTINF